MRPPAAVALFAYSLLALSLNADEGALHRYPPQTWFTRAYTDNFDMSNSHTFQQKVLSYATWWKPGGPILFYLGNEGHIETFYDATGAIFEHAQALSALVVFCEHRYYGNRTSIPDANDMRYLTVEQAMADFAWFIRKYKQDLKCASNECPVVTFGGSYGGMLVAWFRQRYPHLTAGGIAASAPIDFYQHTGVQARFWNASLDTFQKFGTPNCVSDYLVALAHVQKQAASFDGRKGLALQLASCDALDNETTAADKIDFYLKGAMASLAMLDYPVAQSFVTPLPANPVMESCRRLQQEADSINGLRSMVDLFLNFTGGFNCYDYLAEVVGRPTDGILKGPSTPPQMGAWQYQVCNEIPMEPLTTDGFGFFVPDDSQLGEVSASCALRYNVQPRLDWLPLSTGASDLYVGELLFTNGEKDPWRAGALNMDRVPKTLDVVSHIISGAAHHEDLRFTTLETPASVLEAKKMARLAMQRWIDKSQRSNASNAESVFTPTLV